MRDPLVNQILLKLEQKYIRGTFGHVNINVNLVKAFLIIFIIPTKEIFIMTRKFY